MSRDELEQALHQHERALHDDEFLKTAQAAIGDLIIETLVKTGPNLDYWEKDQIASAIDRYAGNVSLWGLLRITVVLAGPRQRARPAARAER